MYNITVIMLRINKYKKIYNIHPAKPCLANDVDANKIKEWRPEQLPGPSSKPRDRSELHEMEMSPADTALNFANISFENREELTSLGDIHFKPYYIEGPSGTGLSSILLAHAFDAEKPSIYILDNEEQADYFQALLKDKLRPGEYHPNDFEFINNIKEFDPRIYTEKSPQPKIIFVTRIALQNNIEALKKIVKIFEIKDFCVDGIHKLKNEQSDAEDEQQQANKNLDALCQLLHEASIDGETPRLLGSHNYAYHSNLDEDFYLHTENTLELIFPRQHCFQMPKQAKHRTKQGLPIQANLDPEPIAFPPIATDKDEAADSITVAKIMGGKIDKADHYIGKIADRLISLPGKTIVRTTSRQAARLLKEAIELRLENKADNISKVEDTISTKSFNWFFAPLKEQESRYLISSSQFNGIHLPYGSYDNFVFADAPTSSNDLARKMSIATSDRNVKIIWIQPINAADQKTYKFPEIKYTEVVSTGPRKTEPRYRTTEIPPAHLKIIEAATTTANIKNPSKWAELLDQLLVVLESPKELSQLKIIEKFIQDNTTGDLSKDQIIEIIQAKEYKPIIFRKFIDMLFDKDTVFGNTISDWYNEQSDERKHDFGLAELSKEAMIQAYPSLMGIESFAEAKILLEQISPTSEFHLGTMRGYAIPANFADKDKIKLLSGLLHYVNIDKNSLLKELNIDKGKIAQALTKHIANAGKIEENQMARLANMIANHQLLTKLFPSLVIDESIPLEINQQSYQLRILVKNKSIQISFKKGEQL